MHNNANWLAVLKVQRVCYIWWIAGWHENCMEQSELNEHLTKFFLSKEMKDFFYRGQNVLYSRRSQLINVSLRQFAPWTR